MQEAYRPPCSHSNFLRPGTPPQKSENRYPPPKIWDQVPPPKIWDQVPPPENLRPGTPPENLRPGTPPEMLTDRHLWKQHLPVILRMRAVKKHREKIHNTGKTGNFISARMWPPWSGFLVPTVTFIVCNPSGRVFCFQPYSGRSANFVSHN